MDTERREKEWVHCWKKGWQDFSSWMNGQSSTVISSSAYFLAFYTFSLWWCDENKCDCLSGMERCWDWDDDGVIESHQQGDPHHHTEWCRFSRINLQFFTDRLAEYWITVFIHFKPITFALKILNAYLCIIHWSKCKTQTFFAFKCIRIDS